ncbi:MAG: lipid-A-disaccharide synthase [Gemmatimonadales bacterium]|nr:lipid-A-disaccharide synthase [Gemmatimonadales bacterium]
MSTQQPPPRIFVGAGEPSGDLHAAAVVAALGDRFPGATIEAFGGPRMAAAGAQVRFPMEGYTVLGFVEVIRKIPAHWRLLQALRREFQAGRHDLVILVDYPGFHLRVAEAARRAGVPVLYYVAPQLWAWRPGRARRFARAVDRLAVILPFEPAFFAKAGIPTTFVGHPLVDRPWPTRAEARSELGIGPQERVLGLFPGSRHQEVAALWPAYRDAGLRLLRAGQCDRVVVAAAAAGEYPGPGPIELVTGNPLPVFAAADAALAKSGTTTLEAAIADVPMVVGYRVHRLTGWLARRLITVPWISLVNLVANRAVVPELVQGAVTAERLSDLAGKLLEPGSVEAREQRAGLAEVRDRLGGGGAAARVAELAAGLLDR